jgi:predicted RNA binding protein YcfA (HicA-like mRNA interferase family)
LKVPRDVKGQELVKALAKFDYMVARQSGSHIHLVTTLNGEHHLTIPAHQSIKVGTLSAILKTLASHHKLSVSELLDKLSL